MDLQTRYDRQLASWLMVCAAVILGMILLGGVTRLTGSGLSIVEWAPVSGVLPPLNEQDWQQTFDKYKQFPEYQKVNRGMSLPEFKRIFLYEYAHRILGRLIGIIFLVPFLVFYFSGRIKPGLTPKLVVMFVLGGLQGLLGWYMVKSGLIDKPSVSQYRLTAHLGNAVIIYGYIIWVAFGLLYPPERDRQHGQPTCRRYAIALSGLVFLMILSGGFVAGTDAGYAYPTFPLMGDSFIPPGIYGTEPFWLAAFEDITTIQFNHRMFAYLLIVVIGCFSIVLLQHKNIRSEARVGVKLMLLMLLIQVTLGISTLLLHMPVPLAAAHQGGAILLFSSVLFVCHRLGN